MVRIFLLLTVSLICSSCYRMPGDDDYSLIPATNNPTVTGQKGGSLMPSTKY